MASHTGQRRALWEVAHCSPDCLSVQPPGGAPGTMKHGREGTRVGWGLPSQGLMQLSESGQDSAHGSASVSCGSLPCRFNFVVQTLTHSCYVFKDSVMSTSPPFLTVSPQLQPHTGGSTRPLVLCCSLHRCLGGGACPEHPTAWLKLPRTGASGPTLQTPSLHAAHRAGRACRGWVVTRSP